MNALKMTLKFWGSGLASVLAMVLGMLPTAFFSADEATRVLLSLPFAFILMPIIVGLTNHWFWKDHDWKGRGESSGGRPSTH